MIWLRYGSQYAISPINCLYSACRGLLVDGHKPEISPAPLDQRASRGFFCFDEEEHVVRKIAVDVERVVANPKGHYHEAQVILTAAHHHHRKGIAHIWLASDLP